LYVFQTAMRVFSRTSWDRPPVEGACKHSLIYVSGQHVATMVEYHGDSMAVPERHASSVSRLNIYLASLVVALGKSGPAV
jgi:hypothetical protein